MIKTGEETLDNGQILEIFETSKGGIVKIPKPIKTEPKPQTILTKAEFFGKMTFEEQNNLVNYEIIIAQLEQDETIKIQKIMAMKTLWTLLNNMTTIDLEYTDVIQTFAQIVSWSELISVERILQILEPAQIII